MFVTLKTIPWVASRLRRLRHAQVQILDRWSDWRTRAMDFADWAQQQATGAQVPRAPRASPASGGQKVPHPPRKVPLRSSLRTRRAPPAALELLLEALSAHPSKDALLTAAQDKDQLYRSLLPLYLARAARVDITSGVISGFWDQQGVRFAAPNAAKALRQHPGFARNSPRGRTITPRGIDYVERRLAAPVSPSDKDAEKTVPS
jgi:hypothetical protein